MRGNEYCGSAVELFTDAEVEAFVKEHPFAVLKAPWSGSGKGLQWCRGEYSESIRKWSNRISKKQRSIIGEQIYNKVVDFAMEFESDGKGVVSFAGYSLFEADDRGAYRGNILTSDFCIEETLAKFVSREMLSSLQKKLAGLLSLFIGHCYKGYLGVDMMVCSFPDQPVYRIHPCVEVNLRMNMGMLSRLLYDKYICPQSSGCFSVDYFSTSGKLHEDHQEKLAAYPLIMGDGRIKSGYLSLTPVGTQTNYRASVLVFDSEEA